MAKQNKKPAPAPEAHSFMDLIRKVGNDTVASMRKDIADGKLPAAKKKASKKEECLLKPTHNMINKLGKIVFMAVFVSMVTGCSPWSQYYTDTSHGATSAYSGSTKLIYSADGKELRDYYAKGYTTVGISSFWHNGNVTIDGLQSLGESKEADFVVYWRSGEHTKTYLYADTDTTYQPGQTYVSGRSYGNQFYGTATTYGGSFSSTTTVTPVSVFSANYEAHFLRKGK